METNNYFFEDYEKYSERAIALYSVDKFDIKLKQIIIWEGYFESLLSNMLTEKNHSKGILQAYFNQTGWYDGIFEITNIKYEIELYKNFLHKVKMKNSEESNQNLENIFPVLLPAIIEFLENAVNSKNKVFIEYFI